MSAVPELQSDNYLETNTVLQDSLVVTEASEVIGSLVG